MIQHALLVAQDAPGNGVADADLAGPGVAQVSPLEHVHMAAFRAGQEFRTVGAGEEHRGPLGVDGAARSLQHTVREAADVVAERDVAHERADGPEHGFLARSDGRGAGVAFGPEHRAFEPVDVRGGEARWGRLRRFLFLLETDAGFADAQYVARAKRSPRQDGFVARRAVGASQVAPAEIVADSGDLGVAARSRRVVDHEIAVRGSTDHREGLDGETTYRAALVAAGEIPDCHAPLLRPPF